MAFANPITGGQGALLRPAIKSPNYMPGMSGWTINRDGTAEFADLTIRSSDGSSTTITIANGVITIRDGDGDIVSEISAAGYRLYDASTGDLLAESTLAGGSNGDPGFVAWDNVSQNSYVFIGNAQIEFGDTDSSFQLYPSIKHSNSNDQSDPITLIIECGRITGTSVAPRIRMDSAASPATRATVLVEAFGGKADLEVTGKIQADNLRSGTAQTPAPGAGGGTSTVNVNFSDAMDATPRVTLAPVSTVDPATVTIRAYVDNVTTAGFTIRCFRSTNSATNFGWVAVSE